MKQTLHLLIVDPARSAVLAGRFQSNWLLPVLTCPERARPGPLVMRWAADRGMSGDVTGQWLGRITRDGAEWLLVLVTISAAVPRLAPLEWLPLDALASTPAVLEYQRWAMSRVLNHHGRLCVNGPFGNLDWPGHVRAWIAAVTGTPPRSLTTYRVSAHEVVLGADGRCFFKGLTAERTAEPRLTMALAAIAPESFAGTLALNQRDDAVWWLTAACPGRPPGHAHGAARTLAQIQQRVLADPHHALDLPSLDLAAVACWTGDLLADATLREAVAPAFDAVARADVCRSWIPMDLDLANLMADSDGAVRFIDMDDSFVGPAPLAIALLASRCGDRTIYRTYEQSWSPSVEGIDWESFEVVAGAIESWLGWDRVKRNVERGEIDASLDAVSTRIRERLIPTIYCR